MRNKYIPPIKGTGAPGDRGRPVDPSKWKSGPDAFTREKYYAFLKHRAQARFRKEQYALTWEDWQSIWPDELFEQRGRGKHNLCLQMIEPFLGWSTFNVEVVTRIEHLQRKRQRELDQ